MFIVVKIADLQTMAVALLTAVEVGRSAMTNASSFHPVLSFNRCCTHVMCAIAYKHDMFLCDT